MANELSPKAKMFHRWVSWIFIVWLLLPLLQMTFHLIEEPENVEKRRLASAPRLTSYTTDGFYQYLHSFELWFTDHFGLRKLLVRANALVNYEILHTSPKAMVVVGKDGWLYYDKWDDGKNLADFYGGVNFTQMQIRTIRQHIDSFSSQLTRMGIPVLFVCIPNKHTVYPEHFPFNLPSQKAAWTRINQIDSIFKAAGIPYLNISEELFKAKETYPYPIYFRTDSHWNLLGAHVGYIAIMQALQRYWPSLKIHPLTDFKIQSKEVKSAGDLAHLIYLGGVLNDQEVSFEPRFVSSIASSSDSIKTYGKYFTNKDSALPRLLMFNDSYTLNLRGFMAESFSKSTFIWNKPSLDRVKKEKPDVVVVEFVERFTGMLEKL